MSPLFTFLHFLQPIHITEYDSFCNGPYADKILKIFATSGHGAIRMRQIRFAPGLHLPSTPSASRSRRLVCSHLHLNFVPGRLPISYRVEVIADYCSNFGHFAFLSPPPLRAWTMYDVGLIGKRAVDFLLVLLGLFSLGVTAEELRANIG